jgi:hypothetical protein
VNVDYLRHDPARARIDGAFGNWVAPLALLPVGAWIAIARPELRSSREPSFDLD